MTSLQQLHLVLPQALESLRTAPDALATAPTLQHWLQRGARKMLWSLDDLHYARLNPWQHALLQALPAAVRDQGLASANFHWRGEGAEWTPGSRLHVEPVHLVAGLDDLRLMFPPPPTPAEWQSLAASLQPLVSLAGFELHATESGHWYLWSPRSFRWLTYSPHSSFATRLRDIMPSGEAAPELKRLMTEVQMLLHDHPVNQHRAHRGIPSINALWFWGDAPLQLVAERMTATLFSNDPYVQGLSEHLHGICWPLSSQVQDWLNAPDEQVVAVLPALPLSELEHCYLKSVNELLNNAQVKQLHIYLDHWRITVSGGWWAQLLRNLRKAQDLKELCA